MSDDTTKPAPTTEPTRRDEHAADELDRNLDGQCPHTGAFRYRVDCGECRRPAFARALAAAREEGRIEERATLGRLPSFNIPISELEEGSEAVPDLSAMFTALAAARREGASEGAAAEHARMVALTTPGTFAIAEERQRQIASEGWTPEHDDEHAGGEMAWAGAAYALVAGGMQPDAALARIWPWAGRWWKPRTVAGARTDENRIRDLTRAGALIAAEIDRLERKKTAEAMAGSGWCSMGHAKGQRGCSLCEELT